MAFGPVTLRRAAWSDAVAAILAEGCDPALCDLDALADQVRRGVAGLIVAECQGVPLGALVARLEREPRGVVYAIVVQRFRPLGRLVWTDEVIPALVAEAQARGAVALRCQVERPGMARRLASHGFTQSAIIMQRAI